MTDRTIAIDYETFYHKTKYSIRGLGNWRYTHDNQFDAFILSVHDGEDGWVGHPSNFNWEALRGAQLVAHNMAFDGAVTDRLIELNLCPDWVGQLPRQCTANLTSFIASTRSLKGAVKVLEKRDISKGVRDEMSGQREADLIAKGRLQAAHDYALHDSVECINLWNKYAPQWSQFERDLSSLTMKQCSRGVRINTELLAEYRKQLQETIFYLEQTLPWVQAGKKVTSPIAIAEACAEVGIPAPPVKSHYDDGDERYEEWENVYGPKYPWVYVASQWRSLNKLLSSLDTIHERLRPDDTIDFSLLYFGAHTGRWSGGGSGLNLQNLKKVPLFLKQGRMVNPPAGLSFKDFKAWVENATDYALDVRRLFIPRPGKKFIMADLAQIEPRVLAWLTGNTAMLELMSGGMSPYEAFARTSMGWTGGDLKKGDPEKYQLSKIQVLGLGYGCGWDKFITIAAGYMVYLEEQQSKEIVDAFRDTNPLIAGEDGMWRNLDNAFKKSVGSDFTFVLPSGRTMNYRDVRREVRSKKNKEGKYEKRFVYTCSVGEKRVETYGGKLTENLVQAVARDVFGGHCLRLEETVGDVIWTVHDEAINEVDLDVTVKDVEHEMSKNPEWCDGLPTAAEATEAMFYKK